MDEGVSGIRRMSRANSREDSADASDDSAGSEVESIGDNIDAIGVAYMESNVIVSSSSNGSGDTASNRVCSGARY